MFSEVLVIEVIKFVLCYIVKLYCNSSCNSVKRWDEALERPNLDYSDIFEEDVGQVPGVVHTVRYLCEFVIRELDMLKLLINRLL